MRDIKKILSVANYIVKNKATVKQVMEEFGMSKKTVLNYINVYLKEMGETDVTYLDLYNEVKSVMKENEHLGKIKGGKTGHRGYQYTDFEIMEVAETIIDRNMTLNEASKYFDIPISTIYDRITNIEDSVIKAGLREVFEKNKNELYDYNSKKTR